MTDIELAVLHPCFCVLLTKHLNNIRKSTEDTKRWLLAPGKSDYFKPIDDCTPPYIGFAI